MDRAKEKLMLMFCRKLSLLGAFWFAVDFLVIVTDDKRLVTIGALGNPRIETPNLDGLLKHGQSWSNFVCSKTLRVPSQRRF